MDCLIIGNGTVTGDLAQKIPKDCYVICADGGAKHLDLLGISADIIVGDMDSFDGEISSKETIKYPVRKDFTDSESAVDIAIEKGFKNIVMVGFTGTRLDHTLTNLFLLKRITKNGASGVIIDSNNEIYYAKPENEILGKIGDIVSIIPVGTDISGITTDGLDYPLFNETLEFGKGRGVSNVMTKEKCSIKIENSRYNIIIVVTTTAKPIISIMYEVTSISIPFSCFKRCITYLITIIYTFYIACFSVLI